MNKIQERSQYKTKMQWESKEVEIFYLGSEWRNWSGRFEDGSAAIETPTSNYKEDEVRVRNWIKRLRWG